MYKERIKLRNLEHFVLTTCKEQQITYNIGDMVVDVHAQYKHMISQHQKVLFDPFRRTHLITVQLVPG